MKKLLSSILSMIVLFITVLSPFTSFALNLTEDELDVLDVYGSCEYQQAFDCLDYINQYRAEVNTPPLVMDKTLLEIAMCRAAECATYATHSRPNSEPWEGYSDGTLYDGKHYEIDYFIRKNDTTNPGSFRSENLTLGGGSMGSYIAALNWYNSEGHKANFRQRTDKSTGIGCFKYLDFEIWIEVFATFNADEEVTANEYPEKQYRSISVEIAKSQKYNLFVNIVDTEYDEEQYTGQECWVQNEQDKIVLQIQEFSDSNFSTLIINPEKVKYSTPNPDKISVDCDGTFTVLVNDNTTATLCATYQGKTYTKQINIVKQEEEPDIPFDPDNPDDPWNPGCDCEYDNGVITEPADCMYYGEKKYTCKKCGNYYYEYYADPTAHKYKTTVTKASTKKNGSVVTKCALCDKVKSKSTIYYPKTVTLSKTIYTYDGKAKKPGVTVKDSKGKTISSKYYSVSYSKGRKNVGKYTVTIKFKGNYSGTIKKTFTIKPKAASISKLTKGKKAFTVKWKKQTQQTTGYQIQYSTSSKFKNAKSVTISKNKTVSKKITKLKAKKKYYVRIRTYKTVKVNGKNVKIYSSWSKAKSVKTK